MKLIEELEYRERFPSGKPKRFAKFFCPFCEKEVVKLLGCGLVAKSCGCQQTPSGERNPNYRHGAAMKDSPNEHIYSVWCAMHSRCSPNAPSCDKRVYFDRGITVCSEWDVAANFVKWAEPLYKPGLYIDRIDNDKGYSPENCRFVNSVESANNQRRVIRIKSMFPEIQKALDNGDTLYKISDTFGICRRTIRRYIKLGQLKRNN